jgi:glycosyltransferase involved in cell wall biosynthesis
MEHSGNGKTFRNDEACIIVNLCSASEDALRGLCPEGANPVILGREDMSPRRLRATRANLALLKRKRFVFYCRDIDDQYNQLALCAIALLAGARSITFTDATRRSRKIGRMGFALKTVPAALALALSMIFICLAFAIVVALLRAGTLRQRRSPRSRRSARSLCYLKTDLWLGLKAGGSVTHTREFIEASSRSGYRVSVIAPDPLGSYRLSERVNVVAPWRALLLFAQILTHIEYNIRFPLGALKVIRKEAPGFLYQRSSQNNVSGVLLSRLTGIPFVLEYNSSARWAGLSTRRSRWSFIEDLCDRINLGGADIIAVVSDELKDRLVKGGIAADRILVNPNGVDLAAFSPTVDASAVRASLPREGRFIGFIGIFGQWHGVLTLMESVKAVAEKEPRAHFVIIGDGTLKDKMVAILERDGTRSAVTFTGVVPHEEAPRFLNACEVLVSPHEDMADGSVFFGSPTKIFEYMAMGKGIVASRVGQLGRILEDGHDAVLVNQKDPRDLARAIVELLGDKELRMSLGREARRKAEDTYSWAHNVARVANALSISGS